MAVTGSLSALPYFHLKKRPLLKMRAPIVAAFFLFVPLETKVDKALRYWQCFEQWAPLRTRFSDRTDWDTILGFHWRFYRWFRVILGVTLSTSFKEPRGN